MAQRFEITVVVPELGTVKHVVRAETRKDAVERVLAAHPGAEHISKITNTAKEG